MGAKPSRKRKFAIIALISLAALIPRIAVSLNVNGTAWPDSWAYISIANSLASGNGYSFESAVSKNAEYRAPLYPLFLAAVFKFTGNNIFFVQLFQSFFGVTTCLLVYGVGKRLFDEKTSLLAAILACVYPFLVYMYPIQPPSDSKNWDATLRGSNIGVILQHHTADSNMIAAKDGV